MCDDEIELADTVPREIHNIPVNELGISDAYLRSRRLRVFDVPFGKVNSHKRALRKHVCEGKQVCTVSARELEHPTIPGLGGVHAVVCRHNGETVGIGLREGRVWVYSQI